MEICTHCDQPRELHVGYDHGRNVCLIAGNLFDLRCLYGEDRAAKIMASVAAWLAARAVLVEGEHPQDRMDV